MSCKGNGGEKVVAWTLVRSAEIQGQYLGKVKPRKWDRVGEGNLSGCARH